MCLLFYWRWCLHLFYVLRIRYVFTCINLKIYLIYLTRICRELLFHRRYGGYKLSLLYIIDFYSFICYRISSGIANPFLSLFHATFHNRMSFDRSSDRNPFTRRCVSYFHSDVSKKCIVCPSRNMLCVHFLVESKNNTQRELPRCVIAGRFAFM